jgi:UDP-N-acetylmuramate dehydrogenase
MAQHTTFRIGGLADAWVRVDNREALSRVLSVCREAEVRTWLLGRGSNVLVSDQGLRGVVICLGGELAEVRRWETGDGGPVTGLVCGAGAALDAVAAFAEEEGLVGAEFLAGIPGTVGGGLHSNAGAFGRSLGDVVTSVTLLDAEGNEQVLTGSQLRREYRRPMVEHDFVAVEVSMELARGEGRGARGESADAIRKQRWSKHPKEPSAGSFFRNPETVDGGRVPAGKLIEQCGLKGKTIGGAKVSEKHANFLVNTGRARFADVYELVQVVKATVEEQTGILLEEEVQYLPGMNEGRGPGFKGSRIQGFQSLVPSNPRVLESFSKRR